MVLALRDRILASPAGSERALTRDELIEFARSVDLTTFDIEGYCEGKQECYARNRVMLNDFLELVVICWLPGQTSAVHDHGKSNCLYLVLEGEMEEELFELPADGGEPVATAKRTFARSDTTIAAMDDIHRISNPNESKLITLHMYSPPLGEEATMYTPIPTGAGGPS